MSKLLKQLIKRFTRQVVDPDKGLISLNENVSVSIIPERAVIIKQGLRTIGFYDKWPEQDKLEYIRDEFIRIIRDPRHAPDPDWTVLDA